MIGAVGIVDEERSRQASDLIDRMDQLLLESLAGAADDTLGRYCVGEARQQPDKRLPQRIVSDGVLGMADAVAVFKRQRRGAVKPLSASDEGGGVLQEAVDHWNSVWEGAPRAPGRQLRRFYIAADWVQKGFSGVKIRESVQKYPALDPAVVTRSMPAC